MKVFVKRLFLTVIISCLTAPSLLLAQDKFEAGLEAGVASKYVWRGLELDGVSLQSSLSAGWKGLYLEAWGDIGLSGADPKQEIDLMLSYTVGGLSFGLTDYWDRGTGPRFFNFRMPGTGHTLEAFAGYDFGPLSVAWYTNVAGVDGVNPSDKRAWSSYLEIASTEFGLGTLNWRAELGIVPWATDFYETGGFAVTNISLRASKDIISNDRFSLPVWAQLMANPCSGDLYFVFGASFSL